MSWDKRRNSIIEKSSELLLEYVVDNKHNNIISYCITTIEKQDEKTGEIDSIFVEETYRKTGLGKQLMENALICLKTKGTETQKLIVGVDNEDVIIYYQQFGFYPLHIVLQKK